MQSFGPDRQAERDHVATVVDDFELEARALGFEVVDVDQPQLAFGLGDRAGRACTFARTRHLPRGPDEERSSEPLAGDFDDRFVAQPLRGGAAEQQTFASVERQPVVADRRIEDPIDDGQPMHFAAGLLDRHRRPGGRGHPF